MSRARHLRKIRRLTRLATPRPLSEAQDRASEYARLARLLESYWRRVRP